MEFMGIRLRGLWDIFYIVTCVQKQIFFVRERVVKMCEIWLFLRNVWGILVGLCLGMNGRGHRPAGRIG